MQFTQKPDGSCITDNLWGNYIIAITLKIGSLLTTNPYCRFPDYASCSSGRCPNMGRMLLGKGTYCYHFYIAKLDVTRFCNTQRPDMVKNPTL